jgi:hypothetical protein
MGDGPSFFFFKNSSFEKLATFWFSELQDARNTWCLCKYSSKSQVVKSKSDICLFIHLAQSDCTQNPIQVRAIAVKSILLRLSLALGIETVVKKMTWSKFY